LNQRDIAKCLMLEDIPSESELDFSDEYHDDIDKDPVLICIPIVMIAIQTNVITKESNCFQDFHKIKK